MCLSRPKDTSSKHLGASDLSILIRIEPEKTIGAVEAEDHEEDIYK